MTSRKQEINERLQREFDIYHWENDKSKVLQTKSV